MENSQMSLNNLKKEVHSFIDQTDILAETDKELALKLLNEAKDAMDNLISYVSKNAV